MTPTLTHPEINPTKLLARLREFVAALNRRAPQVEREGEAGIARESDLLKRQAEKQIAHLETTATS